jgi:hypothetical protein
MILRLVEVPYRRIPFCEERVIGVRCLLMLVRINAFGMKGFLRLRTDTMIVPLSSLEASTKSRKDNGL